MTKPILLFGYGNLSRGDDAAGPLLLEHVQQQVDLTSIDLLTDFQLQIEHILDLQQRQLVIFVDASLSAKSPFVFSRLAPCHDNSYTSHAMSPAALLQVFQNVIGENPPPCFLLGIQARSFELGEPLTADTQDNLDQANRFIEQLLALPIQQILEH
ncbi:MAG: hypothetical protein RL563_1763 [Pseudomonadota bacterium]|jgi:hydrogenase maturation protease